MSELLNNGRSGPNGFQVDMHKRSLEKKFNSYDVSNAIELAYKRGFEEASGNKVEKGKEPKE